MSRSAGTGSPVYFSCVKCRSTLVGHRHSNVTLTGRTRPHRRGRGSMLGLRSTRTAREYVCNECGHVGWSAHIDLAMKAGLTWQEARDS